MKFSESLKENIKDALFICAVVIGSVFLSLVPAPAQVVSTLPTYIDNGAGVVDLGNGPTEVRVLQGNASIFTSSSTGVGSTSGSSTTLTLTATPLTPPCIGCGISGSGITAGTTVASYNSGLIIGLSAAMTVPASSAIAWGAACPSSSGSQKVMLVQPGQPPYGTDLPLYTYARICGGSQYTAGATIVTFPIGAH